jgi:predicted membrane protein
MLHGEIWTVKDLFVYPNEYIYWSIQIVLYPFMTGLVAGAFVLSSLHHVFGINQLRDLARFALVFSLALLIVAPMPLLLHLLQPSRAFNVLLTPHFTSAIAAFGIVFISYGTLVASEIWFVYRVHIVRTALRLRATQGKSLGQWLAYLLYSALTLGSFDLSDRALRWDGRAIKVLAFAGIPLASFLHGYAGFIFGSVKANALWMTPLMPVIFIVSAVVSGIALSLLTYIVMMEIRKLLAARRARRGALATGSDRPESREQIASVEIAVVHTTVRYLLVFLVLAVSLELLDLVFRSYTAVKSWDVLRDVIYDRDAGSIFLLQYGIGTLVPLALLLWPRLSVRRAALGLLLILFGVFMMRWNVVIGGQAFSLSFAGFMHYEMPIIPHDIETFKEGLAGALLILSMPFVLFWGLTRIFPVTGGDQAETSH